MVVVSNFVVVVVVVIIISAAAVGTWYQLSHAEATNCGQNCLELTVNY